MRYICLLLASATLVLGSSILVDWSPHVQTDVQAYVLDYVPAVGTPPAGTSLGPGTRRILLNGTIAAAEYRIFLSAVAPDGARRNVTELIYYSSPDAPVLDSVETTEHEATISYFPPQGSEISYSIDYYPEGHEEYANSVETKAALVRLRGLDSGTTFRLKIRSLYKGQISEKAIETNFTTGGLPSYDYSGSSSVENNFSVRTLPPDFDLATTAEPSYYESSPEESTTGSTVDYSYDTSAETKAASIESIESQSTTSVLNPVTTLQSTSTTFSSSSFVVVTAPPTLPATTDTTSVTTQTSTTSQPAITTTETSSTVLITTTTPPSTENNIDIDEEKISSDEDTDEMGTGYFTPELTSVEQMKSEYGEPGFIDLSEEDDKIRLDWVMPEGSMCDAFLVNYTILTLNRPKSFSIASDEQSALLKYFHEHTLDLRVFCMLAGSVSKTWWAHRIAYLATPKAIEKLRVVSKETNEFYVSQVVLEWEWPVHNFNLYKIIVSYRTGKSEETEIEVYEKGPVTIDKLEAAQPYKFSVRNESVELSLQSHPTTVEQITPPLISSTLYPGQISSTAININFGDSDPEQGRFDYYILEFSGNNKNITKRLEMNQERSLTFTKLIPGKTYNFFLYTVYKGVRSRAVSENITTYPLKVNQLFPVVGRDYVVLYWDIENFADADCRFRVSYNADKIPPVSVELKGASRHRFSALQSDTYYTFTITVIMGIAKAAAESESEMITVHVHKGRTAPEVQRVGSRELSATFENDNNVFSVLNGNIRDFAVIVSDDLQANDDEYTLKSWFDVKDEDVWGSYRASSSDYNPFSHGSSRTAIFTIGSEDCLRRSLDEPYCNGILRSSGEYYVKIRAYSDIGVAMESEWAAVDGEMKEEEEEQSQRRLPCHMYLNGCPRKSSQKILNSSSFLIVLLSFLWRNLLF